MSDEPEFTLTPALTPEEWEVWAKRENKIRVLRDAADELEESFHGMAALALLERPFGFTHDDVAMIRKLAKDVRHVDRDHTRSNKLTSLADRIAALLPPEKP